MRNQIIARVLAGLTIIVAAALLAGLTTYIFGGQFQHPRYWGEDGTIPKVQKIDMDLIEALLTREGAGPLPDSQNSVAPLFSMLDGKLAFELWRGGRRVYENVHEERALQPEKRVIALPDGATLTIQRYVPRAWSEEFCEWVRAPLEWWNPKYDRITAPFLAFFVIYVVFLFALAWRYRARHLSQEVLALLRQTTEPRP